MTSEQARDMLELALSHSKADAATVVLSGSREASTRFANNAITQNVAKADTTLTVEAAFDNRVGIARVNQLTPDQIAEAVKRAEEIARSAAPNTEYMPPIEPCSVPVVQAWDDTTAEAAPDVRARAIQSAIQIAEQEGVNSAGRFATESGFSALLNSRGMFAYHRRTDARFVCTAMTSNSSGWAERASVRLADIDATEIARRAVAKAQKSRDPREVEARPYTVILEPAAMAELLAFFAWSLDAKAADEGRSALSGKLGQPIGVPELTVLSDPAHPDCPGSPFIEDGMPTPTVRWIENGILANLSHSRYWAQKSGRPFTGRPTNLIMEGTDVPVQRLIAQTSYGLLITRFWYIRFVDPMKLLLTGMTRDGVIEIRDGEIVGGVKNMRFNESPLRMFQNIVDIGAPEPAAAYGYGVVPPVKVDGFTFSSGTAF
ncbi:MAG: TldD/PmbA family protein [Chthonomonadales bacterium]|nr:TldD/PmbA family protein [Chthonomonadales bacterium]